MNRKILIALLVLGVVLIVAAGAAYLILSRQEAQPKPPEITLPPSLDEWAEAYPRLADIFHNSELGSVYKEFLVKYEEKGEEAALELARQRGIVVTDEGKEYVYLILILDTEDHSEVVAEVDRYGGKVFSAYKDRVSVGVPVDMVRQQLTTEDPGAIFEDMTGFEHVIAVRLPEPMIPDGSEIEGEGVDVIDAEAWHGAGITGAGEFREARDYFGRLRTPERDVKVVWVDGPRIQEIFQRIQERDIPVGVQGKGRHLSRLGLHGLAAGLFDLGFAYLQLRILIQTQGDALVQGQPHRLRGLTRRNHLAGFAY